MLLIASDVLIVGATRPSTRLARHVCFSACGVIRLVTASRMITASVALGTGFNRRRQVALGRSGGIGLCKGGQGGLRVQPRHLRSLPAVLIRAHWIRCVLN